MSKQLQLYGAGIDMSKDWFHACLRSKAKSGVIKIVAQKKFKNSPSGHQSFLVWLTKHRKDKSIVCRILLEVTGVYHEGLLYYLFDHGLEVCLELSKRVKKYLEAIGQKSKTDKLDGQGIAMMACERTLAKWKPVSAHIRQIRTILRHRKSLIKSKNQFENQMHALKSGAVGSTPVLISLKKMIKALERQIDKTEQQAIELAQKDESLMAKLKQIVDSLKGVGMLSVLTVVAETNGFKEFSSNRQLTSYAGYDVVASQSGKKNGKTRISKKGNAHLRTAVYMPALAIINAKVPPFYHLYQRLIKRNGGIKKKALVAVQRKLLVLIYTLWKKNEPFDLKYYSIKASNKVVVPI